MRHIKILKELFNLNRHHISKDMDYAIKKLCEVYNGSTEEYRDDQSLSWRLPPGYRVIKAELRDSKGRLICSHENNPMHLWSYSPSFSGEVSYSELRKRIMVDFERPEAILFHFRNQYRFWKPKWGFSLNAKQFEMLDKTERFFVEIQTEFYESPLRQFLLNKPKNSKNVILVAHLDHYLQLNDGLGSAIVNNEVVSDLDGILKNINLCSLNSVEILGSVYFLKKNNLNFSNTITAISTNGLTLNENLVFQLSGRKDSQINKLMKLTHLIEGNKSILEEFREGWGNDEIAFEVPGVNIPCASIHRWPHSNYHTNQDDFLSYSNDSFLESKDLIKNIILCIDQNYHIEIKDWHGLICLASPNINLYIEPSNISNIQQKNNLEDLSFVNNLSKSEIEYLKLNNEKVRNFTNKFQSYLSNNENLTIIDVAYEFSLPTRFVSGYFKKLEDKNFVSLIYKDWN